MKANARSITNAIKRAYSAQAQAARSAENVAFSKQQPKVTRLGNGMVVATVENYSPVSRVSFVYNAGARHEAPNQKGVTHYLRNAVNISNQKSSGFAVTKNIQQIGGSLSCTSLKEHIAYSVTCTRNNLDVGFKFLNDVATQPEFRVWELDEVTSRCKLDNAILDQDPQTQLVEAIHAAAYRNGLGNSLYCPNHKIGYYSPEQLDNFVSTHYTSGNLAVLGVGVDHDQLLIQCKDVKLDNSAAPASEKSAYNGGQVRVDTNSPIVHAAIVTEGLGKGNSDLVALYVLQKVMGSGHYIKYGSNVATSKVAQAVAQGTNNPFAASCITTTYSDSGLFGFQVAANANDMDKVLKSVVASFGEATKGSISDADVARAKQQMKAGSLMAMESPWNFGMQYLFDGEVMSAEDVMAAIDKVTTADVNNVAKKVINGKPAMAAVGDLSNTPHLEQLF